MIEAATGSPWLLEAGSSDADGGPETAAMDD
jgi:hypothetical protein